MQFEKKYSFRIKYCHLFLEFIWNENTKLFIFNEKLKSVLVFFIHLKWGKKTLYFHFKPKTW